MRVLAALATLLFALLGLALAPLSVAAFASLNPNVPGALRLLSALEGSLAARAVYAGHALSALDAFWRGVAYLGLCALCVWLAAYLKPRGQASS